MKPIDDNQQRVNLKTHGLALAAMALVAVGCATTHGQKMFQALDSNHDGKVTEQEFAAHISSESFRLLDQNHDGKISKPEWTEKETRKTSEALFRSLDKDHSGSLDAGEFAAASGSAKHGEILAIFHTMDRNHDGALEWNEVTGQ